MPNENTGAPLAGQVSPTAQFNIRSVSNGFVVMINFREEVYSDLDKVVEKLKETFNFGNTATNA